MMIGARVGAWAKSGGGVPTARDYVQAGLVAMWDGIENAGWGVHDPNATVWKDLIGGVELKCLPAFEGGMTFSDTMAEFLKGTNGSVTSGRHSIIGLSSAFSSLESTIQTSIFYTGSSHIGVLPDGGATAWIGLLNGVRSCSYGNNGWQSIGGKVVDDWVYLTVNCHLGNVRISDRVANLYSTLKKAGSSYSDSDYVSLNLASGISKNRFIRIYNRSLSEDEEIKNMMIDTVRFNLPYTA